MSTLRALVKPNDADHAHPVWQLRVVTPRFGRQSLSLDRMSQRNAERLQESIDELLSVREANRAPSVDLERWLLKLAANKPKLHARLVSLGLADAQNHATMPTVGEWFTTFMDLRAHKHGPRSVTLYNRMKAQFIKCIDPRTPMDKVTGAHAALWDKHLAGLGWGENTRRMMNRMVKSLFREAAEQDIIAKSPFRRLESAPIPGDRSHHVTMAQVAAVLDELPTIDYRLVVALARMAGLRSGETRTVEWRGVDWDRCRLTLHASKTDRTRSLPIRPELMVLLREAWEAAPTGRVRIVGLSLTTNATHTITAAIERAGLKVWPDLMQTLRRSCETEWLNENPAHVVSEWIGHSVNVQQKHYAQVLDEHFARVTGVATARSPSTTAMTAAT